MAEGMSMSDYLTLEKVGNKKFSDEQILCAAHLIWFADEDWKTSGKIWDYMSANKE